MEKQLLALSGQLLGAIANREGIEKALTANR